VIAHGLPVYVALEPVDMRFGYERLGGIVRERMQAEPRTRALFVFVGKRGHTMKVLTWDGTGAIARVALRHPARLSMATLLAMRFPACGRESA
jgi:transposase